MVVVIKCVGPGIAAAIVTVLVAEVVMVVLVGLVVVVGPIQQMCRPYKFS